MIEGAERRQRTLAGFPGASHVLSKLPFRTTPRCPVVLPALLPEGEKKSTYLLSSSYRLTMAEKRWVEEHQATVTKLGSFHPGRNFAPLQTNMVRKQKPLEQS